MKTMDHRVSWSIPLLSLAACVSGCAYGYVQYDDAYVTPSGGDASESSGPPVLRYAIPADAPKGQAYVMSLGAETYTAPDGRPSPMLHLRIAVENKSAEPWVIDPADATVAYDDASPISPTYATGRQSAGRQTIAPGSRGELELFFGMPAATRPQHASLRWQVRRGTERTTIASRFELLTGAAPDEVYYQPVYDASLFYAWGPGWGGGPRWFGGGGGGWGSPWWWGGYPYYRGFGPYHRGWPPRPLHRGGVAPGTYGGAFRGSRNFYGGGARGGFPGGGFRGGVPGGGFRGGGGFHGGGRR
jgi:hypothetical protein